MNEESDYYVDNNDPDDDIGISHIKGFLLILLEGTSLLEEFNEENPEVDLSSPVNTQWLERLASGIYKNTDLFCETNTRGIPQKLLSVLRECVLMHRWCEASRVLAICHRETTCDLQFAMWKVGMEILYAEFQRDASSLVERLIKLQNLLPNQPLSPTCMQTEYLLYQSTIDDPEKTLRVISSSQGVVKRYRLSENIKINTYYQGILSAYQGLLWYKLWVKAVFQEQNSEHVVSSYLDKMTECFSTFYQKAGESTEAQDIVIIPHVRTLEHVSKFDEAKKLLQKYRSLNLQNPNAHKYYYYFLCRRNCEIEERLEVLKTLAAHVPSDPLVLTLCEYLQNDLSSCLMYMFDLLDYDCWRKDLTPWKQLVSILENLPSVDSLSETLHPHWSERKTWWPHYHFLPLPMSYRFKDSAEKDLYVTKAIVALFLMDPLLNWYIKSVEILIDNEETNKIDRVKMFLSESDSIYLNG